MLIFVSTYIDCSNMEKKLILDLQKTFKKSKKEWSLEK